jgi:hypothetical protein
MGNAIDSKVKNKKSLEHKESKLDRDELNDQKVEK